MINNHVMPNILVIIPTYNERENISTLLDMIFGLGISALSVLVIDDNSPDRTADVVKERSEWDRGLFLIERPAKLGLGTAYIKGFKFALEGQYEYIFEMDADLSHDPTEIPNFLSMMEQADLVVGSRYIKGINVVNCPLTRLMLSVLASKYTRFVTGMPLSDCTSGFKCFHRKVLESIPLEEVHSNGYSFQIEMNFKAWKRDFIIRELSIVFTDRTAGKSKISRKIIIEAALMVWKLRIMSLFGKY